MPLFLADLGAVYVIVRVSGNEKMRHHLESMGFIVGTKIEVVSKFNGYFLVNVKGARIGIGRDMAKRIIVKQEGL